MTLTTNRFAVNLFSVLVWLWHMKKASISGLGSQVQVFCLDTISTPRLFHAYIRNFKNANNHDLDVYYSGILFIQNNAQERYAFHLIMHTHTLQIMRYTASCKIALKTQSTIDLYYSLIQILSIIDLSLASHQFRYFQSVCSQFTLFSVTFWQCFL